MVNKSHQKSNRGIEEEKRAVSKLTGGQGRPFFFISKAGGEDWSSGAGDAF